MSCEKDPFSYISLEDFGIKCLWFRYEKWFVTYGIRGLGSTLNLGHTSFYVNMKFLEWLYRMQVRKTPRKKARHPIFPYLIKNMPKFDYTCCSMPQDNKTLNQPLQQMKKERVKWTPASKATYRNKLIQNWNTPQVNSLLYFHRSWMVRVMYQSEPKLNVEKKD